MLCTKATIFCIVAVCMFRTVVAFWFLLCCDLVFFSLVNKQFADNNVFQK